LGGVDHRISVVEAGLLAMFEELEAVFADETGAHESAAITGASGLAQLLEDAVANTHFGDVLRAAERAVVGDDGE
jgi:hypothetical protein